MKIMKVWELIRELEQMPAGSVIKVKQCFTDAEIQNAELKVTFTEAKHYVVVYSANVLW